MKEYLSEKVLDYLASHPPTKEDLNPLANGIYEKRMRGDILVQDSADGDYELAECVWAIKNFKRSKV